MMRARRKGSVGRLVWGVFVLTGCIAQEHGSPKSLASWTATEDLRIGSVADSVTMLTRVGAITADSGGDIYVSQPMDADVRVFDAEGRPVRTIGRRGQGPGELSSVSAIGFFGDTLYVMDPSALRVSFFSADGDYLGSRSTAIKPPPLPAAFQMVAVYRICRDGKGFSGPAVIMHSAAAARSRPTFRFDPDGNLLDTVLLEPPHSPMTFELGGLSHVTAQPFADYPLVSLACGSQGSFVVDRRAAGRPGTDSFRVTAIRSIHDTAYSRSYAYEPVPLPADLVDSVVARFGAMMSRSGRVRAREAEAAFRGAMSIPDYASPVSRAFVAADGHLWLRREDLPWENDRWMVLDSLGDPLAGVELPRGLTVMYARAGALWGVVTDSLDIPYVVRYRITK